MMNEIGKEWTNYLIQRGRRERETEIIELIKKLACNDVNKWIYSEKLIKQIKEEKEQ